MTRCELSALAIVGRLPDVVLFSALLFLERKGELMEKGNEKSTTATGVADYASLGLWIAAPALTAWMMLWLLTDEFLASLIAILVPMTLTAAVRPRALPPGARLEPPLSRHLGKALLRRLCGS